MIRSGATVEATAVELLPLTAKYFEILSELAWRGYLIESGGGDVVAEAANNRAARI